MSIFSQSSEEASREAEKSVGGLRMQEDGDLRHRIASSCQLLAAEEHASSLAGQITVRGEDTTTFWTPAWRGGLANAEPSRILLINRDMEVLEGDGQPNPGVRFHLWVYEHRPEVGAIVHTHPPYASILGLVGQPLIVAHMDATIFYDDCAFLKDWPGIPLANEEGRIISEALGNRNSILLAHHGLLTIGRTLDEAVYRAVLLERACRLQVAAQGIGSISPVDGELAREARDFLLKPTMVSATVDYWISQLSPS